MGGRRPNCEVAALSTIPEAAERLGWHSDKPMLLGREAFGEKFRAAKKAESDLENEAANSGKNENKKRKG